MSATLWREQCDAARRLRAGLGSEVAVRYLLGEKFPRFLRAADGDRTLVPLVPLFAAQVATIFDRTEVRQHLPGARYLGAAAQVDIREATMLLARMKALLMASYGGTVERRRAARRINPQ